MATEAVVVMEVGRMVAGTAAAMEDETAAVLVEVGMAMVGAVDLALARVAVARVAVARAAARAAARVVAKAVAAPERGRRAATQ